MIDGQPTLIQLTRRQDALGERVEILLGESLLSWEQGEGVRVNGGSEVTPEQRRFIERLVHDSPDQFILAQLRSAAYRTVQQNLRDDDSNGAENYSGPLWTVVRVDDPEQDERRRPLSRWRLFYLNLRTGLLDKIAYKLADDSIEVEFSEWNVYNGERLPARTRWTRNGHLEMELNVTSVVTDYPQGGSR